MLWKQYNVVDETKCTALPKTWINQPFQIDFYLDCTNEIVIIANVIDAYMSWVSRTSQTEQEINERIVKHLITVPAQLFESYYYNPFWEKVGMKEYQKAKLKLYKVTLTQKGNIWKSTEDKTYLGTHDEQAKQIIADINALFDSLREKCQATEDNAYIQKLKTYDTQLENCHKNFSAEKYEDIVRKIQDELDAHSYHCLSENAELRECFCRLRLECLSLWQVYRSIIA